MPTIWGFDHIENKHTCMKKLYEKVCTSLREHAKNIIDYEKKMILPLTKEELKSYQDAKIYFIFA